MIVSLVASNPSPPQDVDNEETAHCCAEVLLSDADVIEVDFTQGATERLLTVKKPRPSFCRHRQIVVDEDKRQVECAKCHASIDPYEVILRWATRSDAAYVQITLLEKKRVELSEELADLTRQIRNAKSRLQRALKKT